MSRRGFSLFQLLVVLALLVVLLGVAFPAILNARFTAQRDRSLNNLRQIGIACHNHNDAMGRLPPGCDANHFSAAAYLLPYVEQDNLFKTIDFKKPCTDKANETARKATIKVFLSPNDKQNAPTEDGPTNYFFSAGSKPLLADNNGIFYQGSKIRIPNDIPDGTSNTLMAGETLKGDGGTTPTDVQRRYLKLSEKAAEKGIADTEVSKLWKDGKDVAGDRCARWIDGQFLQSTCTSTRLPNAAEPDVSFGGLGGLSTLRSPDAVVNILLCDGSVRRLNVKVSRETWTHLADRADGQVLGPDF